VVKVAVCLLDQCEPLLLAPSTMEQLMEVLRVSLPRLPLPSLELVISRAVCWNVTDKLLFYKIEYQVLQEEEVARHQRERELERQSKQEVKLLFKRVTELTKQVGERDQTIDSLTRQIEAKDRRLANMMLRQKGTLVEEREGKSGKMRHSGV